MRKLTSSLALFLAAAAALSLAEPDTISSSLVRRVTETDIPNELKPLIGLAVSSINANDSPSFCLSPIGPASSDEAPCVGIRSCGPGCICCEGVCMVRRFAEYFDVVILWLKGVRTIEGYDLCLNLGSGES